MRIRSSRLLPPPPRLITDPALFPRHQFDYSKFHRVKKRRTILRLRSSSFARSTTLVTSSALNIRSTTASTKGTVMSPHEFPDNEVATEFFNPRPIPLK